MSDKLWVFSTFMIILGSIMFLAGTAVRFYAKKNEILKGRADAKVVEIRIIPREGEASFSRYRNSQVAFFEFIANGKLVKVRDTSETYPCPYKMGQTVKLVYDLKNPKRYKIDTGNQRIRTGTFFSGLGVASIFAGCILFLVYASMIN